MSTDIGFALNYTNLYLINITPSEENPTWARLGQGISSVELDDSDETSEDYYYDGEGSPETDVTGVSFAYQFEGHRYYGNAAQDYIASLRMTKGSMRRTQFCHIFPSGSQATGECTITDIECTGGDANEKQTFSCKIALNGTPETQPAKGYDIPKSITAKELSATVGEPVQLEVTVTPATASAAMAYASSDPSVASVDDAGIVTPLKAGTCEISLKSIVNPTISAVAKVTVKTAATTK